MKKLFNFLKEPAVIVGVFFIFLIISMGGVSASISHLDQPIKKNQCVNLPQICADCSYNNISSIQYPNSNVALGQVAMQKTGTFYNYTFCQTSYLGTYSVNGYGDPAGVLDTWNYTFEVSPSGYKNLTTFLFIFIVIIVLTYALGMKSENNWVMMFASFLVLLFGFFVIIYGVDVIKDTTTTWAIGLIIWGLGIMSMWKSAAGQLAEGGWN